MTPTPTAYTRTAIALHWLMAFGLLATLSLGLYMADLPLSPSKLQLYAYHKWAGVSLFGLLLGRLAWRLTHQPPALPSATSESQRWLVQVMHLALYGLMVLIPLSGWLMSSAKGFQTVWFGVLPLPDLLSKDLLVAEVLKEVHETLNWVLVSLVIGHAAAAIKHHVVERDGVLTRMLPFLAKP